MNTLKLFKKFLLFRIFSQSVRKHTYLIKKIVFVNFMETFPLKNNRNERNSRVITAYNFKVGR